MNKFSTLLLLFLLIGGISSAQTNHLAKKISIDAKNKSVEQVLILLSEKGRFNFSYNAEIFAFDSIVSIKMRNKTVEKALDQLFNNKIKYKIAGNHIILLDNPKKSNIKRNKYTANSSGFVVSGYITNREDGNPVANATVYEVSGKLYANTNPNGYYALLLPSDRSMKGLTYCRYGYLDTIILIQSNHSLVIDVKLTPRQKEIIPIKSRTTLLEHDIHSKNMVNWLVPPEAITTSDNIDVYDGSLVQVSLLPFVGSNQAVSGAMTNRISLNILAGYSGNVDGAEVGGLVNIVRNDVDGFQMGGLANYVGRNTTGMQIAGLLNINTGDVTGTQIAGFQNTLHGEMHGLQLAGFNNITTQNVDGVQLTGFINVAIKDVNKAQISGFANYGRTIKGLQLSGFSNIATKDVDKVQLSGFTNYCRNVEGIQLTGFANVAKGNVNSAQISGFANVTNNISGVQLTGFHNHAFGTVNTAQLAGFSNVCDSLVGIQMAGFFNGALKSSSGTQAAGFINYAGDVDGLQLAGFSNIATGDVKGIQFSTFFNRAKKLNGVQVALINFADTVEKGVPIGLISFVKKGHHKFSLYTDELFYANAGYNFGVPYFYNVFKIGFDNEQYHTTFGFGTTVLNKEKFNLNIETTYTNIDAYKNRVDLGNIFKITPAFDYHVMFLDLFIGPTLNMLISEKSDTPEQSMLVPPYTIFEHNTNKHLLSFWIGIQAGLRF